MRYLIVICLFIAFSCNNPGTKKNTTEVKAVVPENVNTVAVEVSIKGMTCTGCEQTIKAGVTSIEGVKQVKANFKDGKAYVEFLPGTADTTMIKEKVTASGYVVSGIKSIPVDTLRSKL